MHIESGKSFVGSARNLSIRFKQYFNYNHLTFPKRNMTIYKALLKYGYAGFRLEILEYCAVEVLSAKLQYYVDKCKPEYNISVPDRSEIIIVKNQIHTSAAQIKVLLGGGGAQIFFIGKAPVLLYLQGAILMHGHKNRRFYEIIKINREFIVELTKRQENLM